MTEGARKVVLSLGSNLGDRLGHLRAGVAALVASPLLDVDAVSSVYETQPWGQIGQGAFLNCVLVGSSGAEPGQLLALALGIEAANGRVRQERWGPRTLDIDLVVVGGEQVATAELTLPHPHAHERAFVLLPWLELEPLAALPGWGPVARLEAALACDDVMLRPELSLSQDGEAL